MSTQVMCAKAITERHVDALDVPAIPNAKTTEDRFNTSQYTPAQKKYGLSKLFMILATLLHHNHGIVYLDSNKLLFDRNADDVNPENIFRSVHDVLRWFRFELREVLNTEHMFVYRKGLHGVVVHGPWCICGDARTHVSMKCRAQASLSLAACVNVTRHFLGLGDLSPADDWNNPIDGMFSFQKVYFNFHMRGFTHCRIASAFYKACVGGPNNGALINNGLAKGAEDDPIATNLREYRIRGFKARTNSTLACKMARNYLSRLPDKSMNLQIVVHLMNILRYRPVTTVHTSSSFLKWRFERLLSDHTTDDKLRAKIRTIRDLYVRANSGNETAGREKAPSQEKIEMINTLTHFVLKQFGPTSPTIQGEPFFVQEFPAVDDSAFSEQHPANPKNLPVVRAFCYATLAERMKSRTSTGLNCKLRAVRYPCISVSRATRTNGFVEVRLGVKRGKQAEYLGLRQTNPGLFPPPTSAAEIPAKKKANKKRKPCQHPGCTKYARAHGYCSAHGPVCQHPGCTKIVRAHGYCSAHGPARKKCEAPGCTKYAVQGGKCYAHGARRKRCSVAGCTKFPHRRGMCKKHLDQAESVQCEVVPPVAEEATTPPPERVAKRAHTSSSPNRITPLHIGAAHSAAPV